jgi:hypothetical protein
LNGIAGQSDHCTYFVSAIYGGTFSIIPDTAAGDSVFYSSTIAAGYKAVKAGSLYYVLPEIIANAAKAAGVTAVTESTADVATALATNNGEATMFMWNDVAYIAKYGEVVITSAADEATTVRGVVESSAGLTSATVADGIEVVGNRTFRKCANLETVALPNTLTEIGPAVFQSCSKLANITIPASVTTIGEGAFAECTSLTSINIPAGITRLEKDVLRNTGLVSVEIPASVNYIGTYAFRDCESLTEVKILSPEFTIESNTFTNMAAPVPTMTIYVVNAEMKAYLDSTLTNYDKSYITVVGPTEVSTAAELVVALENDDANIILKNDIQMTVANTGLSIATGNTATLNLNGHNIEATSTSAEGVELFSVNGNLNIVGNGTISLTGDNFAWNTSYRYAAINIREKGVVTLGEDVTVVCEASKDGGYGMSYAVDIYTTGTLNVNGASLHSNYIAVRCFYGNSVVNVNSGSKITSSKNNYGIWLQSSPGAVVNIADGVNYTFENDIYYFN